MFVLIASGFLWYLPDCSFKVPVWSYTEACMFVLSPGRPGAPHVSDSDLLDSSPDSDVELLVQPMCEKSIASMQLRRTMNFQFWFRNMRFVSLLRAKPVRQRQVAATLARLHLSSLRGFVLGTSCGSWCSAVGVKP